MGRTVALTKTIFKKKKSRTIEAKTPIAPASVFFFLLSVVFILAVALKMEVNK